MKKLLINPPKDGRINHPMAGVLRAQERKSARAKLKLKQMRFFQRTVEEKISYSSKLLNLSL